MKNAFELYENFLNYIFKLKNISSTKYYKWFGTQHLTTKK